MKKAVLKRWRIAAVFLLLAVTGSANNGSVIAATSPTLIFSYKPACVTDSILTPLVGEDFSFGGSFTSDANLSIDAGTGNINPGQSHPGFYTVTYTLDANGFETAATGTANVLIEAAPVLTICPDITITPGSGSVISVSGGSLYSWTPAADLSCNDCASPVASPGKSTQYCVFIKNNSCSQKACVNVLVDCGFGDFSLPNAFTPNGDGFNDQFCLQGWDKCIDKFSVLIFDRWGEKVFESGNPNFCWDGSYNGKVLETDVMVYSITASFTNGSSISKKGNITLLR